MEEECELSFTALRRGNWVETRKPLFVPHTMPPVCLPTSPNQSVLQHMMALMFSITTVNAQIGP